MKEKKNKKKILFIALFLFAIAGVVGYGVYSYYWAQGSVTATSNTINVSDFDVEVSRYTDYDNKYFLTGNIDLTEGDTFVCTPFTGGFHCSAPMNIYNDGDKDVIVSVTNLEAYLTDSSVGWEIGEPEVLVNGDPISDYLTIEAGGIDEIGFNVDVSIPEFVLTDDETATLMNSPFSYGGSSSVQMSYTLTATEVHD